MRPTRFLIVVTCLSLSGCAGSQFRMSGPNEYTLSKMSDACAIGVPGLVLAQLRDEAARFCGGRKEVAAEISSDSEMGIPILRCTSATLTFRCDPYPADGK